MLIGTGLRKGECIAPRWSDLDMTRRIAHVRQTLSSVDNSRLIFARADGHLLRPEYVLRS